MATLEQLRRQAEDYYNMKAAEFKAIAGGNVRGNWGNMMARGGPSPQEIQAHIMATGGNPYAAAYEQAKSRTTGRATTNPYQRSGRANPTPSTGRNQAPVRNYQNRATGSTPIDRVQQLKQLADQEREYLSQFQTPPQTSGVGSIGDRAYEQIGARGLRDAIQGMANPGQRPQVQYQPDPYAPYQQQLMEMQQARQLQAQLNEEYKAQLDSANAANEDRYKTLVEGATDLHTRALDQVRTIGQQQLSDIDETYRKQGQANYQGLAARGLTGTTVLPAVGQVLAQEKSDAQRRAQEDITRRNVAADTELTNNLLGIVERRTDAAPDLGQLAAIQQAMGAGGNGMALSDPRFLGGGMGGAVNADGTPMGGGGQNYIDPRVQQQQSQNQFFPQANPAQMVRGAPGTGNQWQPPAWTPRELNVGGNNWMQGSTGQGLPPRPGINYPRPGQSSMPPNFLSQLMPGQTSSQPFAGQPNQPWQRPTTPPPAYNSGSGGGMYGPHGGNIGPMYLAGLQQQAADVMRGGVMDRLTGGSAPMSQGVQSGAAENWRPSGPVRQPSNNRQNLGGGWAPSYQGGGPMFLNSPFTSFGIPAGAGRGGGTGYQYPGGFGRSQTTASPTASPTQGGTRGVASGAISAAQAGGVGGMGSPMMGAMVGYAPQLQAQMAGVNLASNLGGFNIPLGLLGR